MRRNWIGGLTVAFVLALGLVFPALAGGWAVVTLDELPRDVLAGRATEVGFMVRQHGITPLAGLDPEISLRESGSSNRLVVIAEPQGKLGHYMATITLPAAGTWEWSINAFGFAQVMPALTVGGASPTSISAVDAARGPWAIAFGLAAMALVAGLGIALVLRRVRWATALAPIAVILGVVGFLALRDAPSATGQELASVGVSEGQALFVAKGCVVCHTHSAVSQVRVEMESQGWGGFGAAPDLTGRTFSRSFLISWLKNPQATKPDTQMPNLGLSETEIMALADFINGGNPD